MRKAKRLSFNRVVFALLISLIPVVMALVPMEWLVDDGHTLCVWRNLTGEECYGCGMTRALVCVVKLRWGQAYEYNRLVVLVAPLLAWLWARWLVRVVDGR